MKTFLLFAALTGTVLAETDTPRTAWQSDFSVRLRFESREQNSRFDRGVTSPTDGAWVLSRVRLGLKGQVGAGVLFYAQMQDAREIHSDRPSVPYVLGSEGDDPLDLRQFYLERRTGEMTWRVGRQILA